ncbi:translocation/assembly module TamB domain-containing protein [Roseicyclus sp.]|uniref:translocation/assembly module TamB domain-containing protein n=1 Tax=Roseicyclus sp. TaxID=1914329 RepID=UPI003F6D1F78
MTMLFALLWSAMANAQADDDRSRIVTFLETQLSDGARQVSIEGFRGALSASAQMDVLTIADDAGVWLRLEGARLDWSRAALLRGALQIDTLQATRLEVLRRPNPSTGLDIPQAEATPFRLPQLPVSIAIAQVRIERVTLGADILGMPAELAISGSAALADGQGSADLAITRLDGPRGRFDLRGSYQNDSRRLALSLDLAEDAGGLVATRLGLPDAPAIALRVMGDGPIDDFRAEIALSSDGAPRLTGQVTTTKPTETGTRTISADLSGDITPLFLPAYRPFFGPEVAFSSLINLAPDGSVVLDDLRLSAAALSLDGRFATAADGRPSAFDLRLRMADPTGQGRVRLPISGANVTVGLVDLTLRHDASSGPEYTAQGILRDLVSDGFGVAQLGLEASGRLQSSGDGLALAAPITVEIAGLDHRDPAIAAALGNGARLGGTLDWATGAPILLRDMALQAGDIRLAGGAGLNWADGKAELDTTLAMEIADLSRFAALAKQPLAGRLAANLTLQAEPLSGAFDMVLDGTGRALRLGAGLPPQLLAGQTDLALSARRDETGFALRNLKLTGSALTLDGTGRVSRDGALVALEGRLADIGLFTDALSGAVTAALNATRGPTAQAPWQLRADIDSAAGIDATVSGAVMPEAGTVALRAQGALPLALANRALAPRSIGGRLAFDVALQGEPSFSALTGSFVTDNARLSLPSLQTAIENIRLSGQLSDGQLQVDLDATQADTGRVTGTGSIDLTSRDLAAQISLSGVGLRLSDPTLYDARIDRAAIRITGGLAGALLITGDLALGQTDLRVPESGLGGAAPIPPILHQGESAPERRTRIAAGLGPSPQRGGGSQNIALDLTITAPGRIFLRGRGLDAELGGSLRIGGTTAQIIPSGRFDLIRGRLSILGTRLDLTEGAVTLTGNFDPTIDLLATSRSGAYLIGINISGPVSTPEIRLTATPPLPEDEILAQLLFGRTVATLSPLQLLQMVDAATGLAGGSSEAGILANLREGLGLDDLDLRTDATGNAALRAGRYLSENVYTDVTIAGDGGADISLNIDLTPNITARGGLSADGETRLGVFFERDY